MEKIVFAYWCSYDWQTVEEGHLEVRLSPIDYALEDYTFLGEFAITVPVYEVPSQTTVNLNRIKYLEIKKEGVQAEAFIAAKALEEKIQDLLALPAEV